MALFKKPSAQDGFFVPEPGSYIGELVEMTEFNGGKYGPSVRWQWVLYSMDTKLPILFEGKPAKVDALSSPAMGPSAKARKWANAHLAPNRRVIDDEDPEALQRELIGKRVILTYVRTEDDAGKKSTKLSSDGGVMALD